MLALFKCRVGLEKMTAHFIPLDRTDAATITDSIKSFLDKNNLLSTKVRAIKLDGAAATSGVRTAVQARLRYPMAIYIHCRYHQLQWACVYAAKSVNPVCHTQSNILVICKLF